MRIVIALCVSIALAACGQSTSAPVTTEQAAEAPAAPALTGEFTAMSNTATAITGDVSVTPDVLSFAKGFRIEGGRIDAMLTPTTDLSAGGGTIADGSGNTTIQTVELRQVTLVRVAADAPDPGLCGQGSTASHVILANGPDALSILVFSGADAPGPNARDTTLCAIFNYAPVG